MFHDAAATNAMAHKNEDPVIRNSRRESIVALVVWLAAMTYTVGYCWLNAYDRPPEDLRLILGAPDWVVWGIAAPWSVCVVVCAWFAYAFMSDESLGSEESAPNDDGSWPGETDLG